MATVYVNDQPVDIGHEKLNAIEAAKKAGVFIPHYCWHPALTVVASCRMCLVEIGERKPDGTIVMQGKVVPGCQTPVKDGSVVVTNSPKAKNAQADTLEGLLLNHPLDCPVCDKAGECLLQDFSYRFGRSTSRMIDDKNTPPNKPEIGANVTLFTDRCIMCTRCVRFTREISGEAELQVTHRGHHAEIDIFPGVPLNNKLATNVVDLCPVGALCSKDFLYTHRVWNLKTQDSVCADCSTGCSIHLDTNKNVVYRLRPRENPLAQGHFMCDDGRLGYHYANSPQRLNKALARQDNALKPITYESGIRAIRAAFTAAAHRDPNGVVGVLSPFLTCEEAYLLARYIKGISAQARLAIGPIPVLGEDDTYPKDRRGRPVEPVKFTIRAEKCPNRRGVEQILRHFQGDVMSFEEIILQASAGQLQAVFLSGSYPPRPGAAFGRAEELEATSGSWISSTQAEALRHVPTVVVHDLFASPGTEVAHFVLPAATWAEKDGLFVNHAGLAQEINRAGAPTGEIRTEGQVYLDLLERRGLIHAATIRKEMGQEIPFFGPLVSGAMSMYGLSLTSSH